MPHLSLSSCIVLATLSAIFIIISFTLTSPRFHVNFLEVTRYFQHTSSRANTLGVASKIIVINLPRRTDRKIRMTAIQKALNLTFDWADATDASEEVVDRIMERVRKERGNEIDDLTRSSHSEWSLDANITRWNNSATPLGLWGADLWTLPPTDPRSSDMTDPLLPIVQPDIRPAIPCQQNMSSYNPSEPKAWQILSPAMVACWHSHLTVLRRVAEGIDEVTIIFEDDVDVEWDLENRLVGMWDALPKEWDIVALGHCWSAETTYPPLLGAPHLHPSHSPKCNHAYAVSRGGAAHLVRHLRTPWFAYGRALDQAIVYLIQTGRIIAFSVHPSVVVQTKDIASDIMHGNGSTWKETLEDSALERIGWKATNNSYRLDHG